MKLIERIHDVIAVRLSPFGEAAIRAYATLPGAHDDSSFARFEPIDAQRIVEAGWPLAVLGNNESLQYILRKSKDGMYDRSDWSVIHAGAMLTRLGARVEFLKESQNTRTADIRAWWGSAPVDVEVRTAMVKDRQAELGQIVNTLSQVIGTGNAMWHPLIHLGDVPCHDVQSAILDAVLKLHAGQRAGLPDLWEVYAVPLNQESALDESKPAWWNDDSPSLSSNVTFITGNANEVRRVRIVGKLQSLSYINQVRGKADRLQGDPNHPYLIVLDQGSGPAVPMRHKQWQDELQGWLPIWKEVSGILCFDQRPYIFSKFCWKLSFHPNPDADRPLPNPILSLSPHDVEICDTPFL